MHGLASVKAGPFEAISGLILENAIDLIGDPVMILDTNERIVWCNQAFCLWCGLESSALIGEPAARIFDPADAGFSYHHLSGQPTTSRSVWKRRPVVKCGTADACQADETITAITDAGGAISHYISVLHDVSAAQNALHAQLLRSNADALTGVATRTHLLGVLENGLNEAIRNNSLFGILFIDLDGFKHVNDVFGHLAGDAVLNAVGARLRSSIRSSDTVGRFGGDEFVVLLPNLSRRSTARDIGNHLVDQLGQPYALASATHRLGASIGLAFFPDHGDDAESILDCADAAMYRAKRQGGRALATAVAPMPARRESAASPVLAALLSAPHPNGSTNPRANTAME